MLVSFLGFTILSMYEQNPYEIIPWLFATGYLLYSITLEKELKEKSK
jgi:hypothetical protein